MHVGHLDSVLLRCKYLDPAACRKHSKVVRAHRGSTCSLCCSEYTTAVLFWKTRF